jgi:hypothetical protein
MDLRADWTIALRKRGDTWLLAGLAGFCLIMAMGEQGFLFGWLKRFLPLIGIARYPVKFMLLAAFIIPPLAAWGVRQMEAAEDNSAAGPPPSSNITCTTT